MSNEYKRQEDTERKAIDDALKARCEKLMLEELGLPYVHNTALDALVRLAREIRKEGYDDGWGNAMTVG